MTLMDERGGAISGPAALTLHDFEIGVIDSHAAEQELMDLGWSSEAISNALSDRQKWEGTG
jgi:hypothetical protein